MKYLLITLLICLSFLSKSQSALGFDQINKTFEAFSKSNQESSKSTNKHQFYKYYGSFPNESFHISNHSSISFSSENQILNEYLQAIILNGLFNTVTYEYVADLFNTSTLNGALISNEFLKLKIAYGVDSTSLNKRQAQKLNKIETIEQHVFSEQKKLRHPIEVFFYSSSKEIDGGINRTKKIIIQSNAQTLYEVKISGNTISIKNNNIQSNNSYSFFNYTDNDKTLEVNGGLFNHILIKRLEEISKHVLKSSTLIKNVHDSHSKLNKGIIRSISRGATENMNVNINNYVSPKFDTIQTFELENNDELIIEWYSKHQKRTSKRYSNRILNGSNTSWFLNGNIHISSNYANGNLHGKYNEYYSDLTPKIITEYKNGKIYKNYKEFHENGVLKKSVKYRKAVKNGYTYEYFDNGKLKFKGRYKKNQPVGWHKYYDQNGNPIKKNKFRKGVITKTKIY